MQNKKKEQPKEKARLHPRNKNRDRYNFDQLIDCCPDLKQFVTLNKYNDKSIDFANPAAVKMLNKALLKSNYGLEFWDIPENYLCPPIPGRADYIHHIADLLCRCNYGTIPTGKGVKCVDVGVGANCIYPIIGVAEYGWSFIGSDVDEYAIESATNIAQNNELLKDNIEFRYQDKPRDIFFGIIGREELVDLTICNPPFHASAEDALSGTMRKLRNLSGEKVTEESRNFGGVSNELWCEGGENKFVREIIRQSTKFSKNCFWFSTLISKQSNLKGVYNFLKEEKAVEVVTIPMGQGNKTSRVVAWTFLNSAEQKNWKVTRWAKSVDKKEDTK